MRVFLKSGTAFLRTGWFWAFVLLALPNCALNTEGLCAIEPCDDEEDPPCEGPNCPPPPCEGPDCVDAFDQGGEPVADAIMCEFPVPEEGFITCATAAEAADPLNVSLTEAATALATNRKSAFALDWSPDSLAACAGKPRKFSFMGGSFPDGFSVCINCGEQIPLVYASPAKACIAKCQDVMKATYPGQFTMAERAAHCEATARTATNYDTTVDTLGTMCFLGACTAGGNPDPSFFDPRRIPEPVQWANLTPGLTDSGGTNTLTRTAAATGPDLTDWNEGAQSVQAITKGDAWVDFYSTTIDGAHAMGVRESRTAADLPCENIVDCQDGDPSLEGIGISLDLNHIAKVFVIETVPVFAAPGPFDPDYFAGERFRIHIKDRHDGTATVSYSRIIGPCNDGEACVETEFYESSIFPRYPLRVDASFRDPSTFADVKIVRIK